MEPSFYSQIVNSYQFFSLLYKKKTKYVERIFNYFPVESVCKIIFLHHTLGLPHAFSLKKTCLDTLLKTEADFIWWKCMGEFKSMKGIKGNDKHHIIYIYHNNYCRAIVSWSIFFPFFCISCSRVPRFNLNHFLRYGT